MVKQWYVELTHVFPSVLLPWLALNVEVFPTLKFKQEPQLSTEKAKIPRNNFTSLFYTSTKRIIPITEIL